jgi:hypothetical protein
MTYRPRDEHMSDPNFCRGKEEEYSAKAKAATSPGVKSAFEATAREYARRLTLIETGSAS